MREQDSSPSGATLTFSREEVAMVLAAIGETLEAVEDWELPIRTGFEPREFALLQESLGNVYAKMSNGGPD